MKRIGIDLAEIVRLYRDERLSVAMVAARLQVSYSVIYDRLVEAGVPRREKTEPRLKRPDPVELQRLYVDERMSTRAMEAAYRLLTPHRPACTLTAWQAI